MSSVKLDPKKFMILSLTGNHDLDEGIIGEINNECHAKLRFSHLNLGRFPDGESDVRIPDYQAILGKHVVLMQSAYDHNLMLELLDIAYACKHQYGAKSLTVVMPFMYYRRQDAKRDSEINRSKWLAHNLKSNGADNVILCDIHSQTTLRDFREVGINVCNVDPNLAYARHLRLSIQIAEEDGRGFYIYVPDEGSIPRAKPLAELLNVPIAINLKVREENGSVARIYDENRIKELEDKYQVKLVEVDESLAGASFCIREDELSTGGTAAMAAVFLKKEIKAHEVLFCGTHAVCADGWKRKIIDPDIFDNIFLGNTIPRGYYNSTGGKISTVDISHQLATQIILMIRKFE